MTDVQRAANGFLDPFQFIIPAPQSHLAAGRKREIRNMIHRADLFLISCR
jgi:hypothetical protein